MNPCNKGIQWFSCICPMSEFLPSVLKTICHVSPGASSPTIFELRRHFPIYGVLGLYVLTIPPSSSFLECFLAGTGVAAAVSVSTDALMKETFFPPSADDDSTHILFPLKKAYHRCKKFFFTKDADKPNRIPMALCKSINHKKDSNDNII